MEAFVAPAFTSPSSFTRRRTTIAPRQRPARTLRQRPLCCARAAPKATQAVDIPTLAQDIKPSATDALLSDVHETLSSGSSLSQQTLEAMVIHLADARGMARLGLVEAFGKVGSPGIPALLAGLSSCPNPVVRRSCGKALAKIGDAVATGPLLTALVHDEDTVTRSSAAGALARMGSVAVPRLLELISNPDVGMTAKGHAAWAIAFMQGDASIKLFESLRHPNRDVRIAVVSALGAVAIGDALPAMAAASDDDWDDDNLENAGLRDRAIEAISIALGDESPEVRAEAATALANAGCREEVGRIAVMLGDEDPELRRCAALALMKLGDPSTVERLREREMDDSEVDSVRSVARLAANSLERSAYDGEWE